MDRVLRSLFIKTDEHLTSGPKGWSPIYTITGADGIAYRVQRKQWVLPTAHWGWSYQAIVVGIGPRSKMRYADTLEEVAANLGLLDGAEAR